MRRISPVGGQHSNHTPHASTGTLGGIKQAVGSTPGRKQIVLGDEMYLWMLLAVEVGLISWARSIFSRYHGG